MAIFVYMYLNEQIRLDSATLKNVYHSFIQSSEKHKMIQMFGIGEWVCKSCHTHKIDYHVVLKIIFMKKTSWHEQRENDKRKRKHEICANYVISTCLKRN